MKARELNDRLMMAERSFTDRDGLFERSWYKHLVSFQSRRTDTTKLPTFLRYVIDKVRSYDLILQLKFNYSFVIDRFMVPRSIMIMDQHHSQG